MQMACWTQGKTMSLICGLMTWLRKFNATFHEASDVPSTAEGVGAATAEAAGARFGRNAKSLPLCHVTLTPCADEPSWLSSFSVHTSASMLAQRKAVWAKSRQRFLKRLARLSARANLAALTASRSEAAVSSVSGIGGGKRGRSVPKSLTASPAGQPDFTLWDAEPKEAAGPAADAGLKARLVADALRAERSDSDGSTDAAPTPVPALPGAYRPVQIVFASRTHSQLSQFVAELRATKWGADARVVMLGGRRHLCCYAPVRSLGSDVEMTEACLRLRDAGRRSTARQAVMAKRKHIPLTSAPGEAGLSAEETALRLGSAVDAAGREVSASSALAAAAMRGAALTGSRCPANVPEGIELMRNHLLSRPLDIEEAAAGGMEAGVCAYYAARKALPLAEVVALPYNLLLSAPSRQALGLDLTDSVVVIDEAHNIINSVIDVHSVTLPHSTLQAACGQLEAYLAKYRTRLAARNRQQCTLLLKLAKGLDKAMHSMQQQGSPLPPGLSAQRAGPNKYLQGSVSAFVAWAGVEEVNAHALLRWTHESGVCNKLRGFTEAAAAAAGDRPASATASQRLVSLLEAWAASDQNGSMFLVQPGQGEAYLRYTLLNAAAPMAGILREARSVVMAGGTMKPVEEVVAALLPSVPRDRLVTFSCGHVIPPSALTVATLPRGPRGIPLNFTHARRSNGDMLVDFGAAIVNAARALPGGLALFVPSYDFIDLLLGPDGAWGSAGAVQADAAGGEGVPGALAAGPPGSILARLQASKAVFLERRGGATREGGASPSLWASYAACIASGRGAVLVCVMGGKLSEGINFKDDLARTVVVAGLPYATPHDPELVARMAFFDALRPGGGREYYENLCMKAVNQSIGRVIRHAGDHGVVLLADERYNKPAVQARLPEWIQPRSHTCHSFGEAFKTVVRASRGATSTSGGGQQG